MSSEHSYANAQKQFQLRLAANPIPSIPNSSVHWELAPFTTPAGDYARVNTTIADTTMVQAGGGWNRSFGTFYVDMFYRPATTENHRNKVALDAEHVQVLFHQQRFDSVNCEDATISPVGVESDTGLYHMQVRVIFYYEGP